MASALCSHWEAILLNWLIHAFLFADTKEKGSVSSLGHPCRGTRVISTTLSNSIWASGGEFVITVPLRSRSVIILAVRLDFSCTIFPSELETLPVAIHPSGEDTVVKKLDQLVFWHLLCQHSSTFRKLLLITNLSFSCYNPNIFLWVLQQACEPKFLNELSWVKPWVWLFFGAGDKKEVWYLFRFHSGRDLASLWFPCLFYKLLKWGFSLLLLFSPSLILTAS